MTILNELTPHGVKVMVGFGKDINHADLDVTGFGDYAKLKLDGITAGSIELTGTYSADSYVLVPPSWEPTPRIDVELVDLLKRIDGFTIADEIARYFYDQGVRGSQAQAADCPFAKWIKVETGKDYRVGSRWISPPTEPAVYVAELSPAARDFVSRFDSGFYPQLVQGHIRQTVGSGICPCVSCSQQPVIFA